MRLGELRGLPVVDRESARDVGRVESVLLDAAAHRIASIAVVGDGDRLVEWDSVTGVGDAGVVFSSGGALRQPSAQELERVAMARRLIGKRVVTSEGTALGRLDDVVFDDDTGVVDGLVVDGADVRGSRLRALGSYALVVE